VGLVGKPCISCRIGKRPAHFDERARLVDAAKAAIVTRTQAGGGADPPAEMRAAEVRLSGLERHRKGWIGWNRLNRGFRSDTDRNSEASEELNEGRAEASGVEP
jgi:hypothetical protein